MNYDEYISSPAWAAKRDRRKEIDGNRCRLCDHDGSQYQLEVHHRPLSYVFVPNESVENDLTTLCKRCHDLITNAIREDRYGRKEYTVTLIESTVSNRQEIPSYGMGASAVQTYVGLSTANAQRADSRPTQQVVKIDETDFIQEGKDRCRPRSNGTS